MTTKTRRGIIGVGSFWAAIYMVWWMTTFHPHMLAWSLVMVGGGNLSFALFKLISEWE